MLANWICLIFLLINGVLDFLEFKLGFWETFFLFDDWELLFGWSLVSWNKSVVIVGTSFSMSCDCKLITLDSAILFDFFESCSNIKLILVLMGKRLLNKIN